MATQSSFLSKGDRSQAIFSFHSTTDAVPLLLWVGDLDGDGQLDLLIAPVCNNAASARTLFLPSAVQADSLLRNAVSSQLRANEANRCKFAVKLGAIDENQEKRKTRIEAENIQRVTCVF